MNHIQKFLDSLTMYRATMLALVLIVTAAIGLSLFDLTGYAAWQIIGSLVIISGIGFGANVILAKLFNVPANIESSAITHMILVLIMPPFDGTVMLGAALAITTLVAAVSKYLVTYKSRHIFNPAAFSAFFAGLVLGTGASWWVATPAMLPIVAITGILIVRKIRRLQMIGIVMAIAVVSVFVTNMIGGSLPDPLISLLPVILLSYPLVFFAFYMVTEPMTSPSTNRHRLIFAGIIGVLFGASFELGPLTASPEFALIMANVYVFVVSSKGRVRLRLVSKRQESDSMTQYEFAPDRRFDYRPGQYVDMTIDMPMKDIDSRGTRRFFTIASAPHERTVKFGVRRSDKPSVFKQRLSLLKPDDDIVIGAAAGDFTLPANRKKPLLFLAGGVGITPFRSIISDAVAKGESRDIVLIYSASSPTDIAYRKLFDRAHRNVGLKVHYLTDRQLTGELLIDMVPDIADRRVYISGPGGYVDAMYRTVSKNGVARRSITTDYFPGI